MPTITQMPFPMARVPVATTRHERIEALKSYFLRILAEDTLDGSRFDCDVLDSLDAVKTRHTDE